MFCWSSQIKHTGACCSSSSRTLWHTFAAELCFIPLLGPPIPWLFSTSMSVHLRHSLISLKEQYEFLSWKTPSCGRWRTAKWAALPTLCNWHRAWSLYTDSISLKTDQDETAEQRNANRKLLGDSLTAITKLYDIKFPCTLPHTATTWLYIHQMFKPALPNKMLNSTYWK